jgi:hypothetical protein
MERFVFKFAAFSNNPAFALFITDKELEWKT